MKTTTLGLLGAERAGAGEGRGGSRCPGPPRLPGDPPAGKSLILHAWLPSLLRLQGGIFCPAGAAESRLLTPPLL